MDFEHYRGAMKSTARYSARNRKTRVMVWNEGIDSDPLRQHRWEVRSELASMNKGRLLTDEHSL